MLGRTIRGQQQGTIHQLSRGCRFVVQVFHERETGSTVSSSSGVGRQQHLRSHRTSVLRFLKMFRGRKARVQGQAEVKADNHTHSKCYIPHERFTFHLVRGSGDH
ncbi:unnamed protein product, partial [Ectocarpus sp. 4 AP-2014]